WPRRVESAVAAKLGDGTPAGVKSSYGLALLAQLAVDRGRCADVAVLADAGEAVRDGGRPRHRPELLYLAAGCRLHAGKPREAAEQFGKLLQEFPDAAKARDASYYRFRALDVARATDPSLTRAYDEALAAFATRYPKDDAANEARCLLGELRRAEGDCPKAE